MSNTTADVTGIFSLDTNRLVGLAAKGSPDVTYLAGQDTPTSGIPLTATLSDVGVASLPISLAFPDFTPCIVASFVAGSTASQTGNTVTVTATAHGIVGSAVKNGYRIYYPGSPSIPAGWYAGFAWVNANTVTFQRATSADVSSESINAGAAFTSVVTVGSLSLPGGSLGDKGRMSLRTSLHGDQVSAAKTIRILSGAVTFAMASTTTSPSIHQTLSVTLNGFGQQIGVGARDGSGAGGQTVSSVDMSISQPIACAVNVTNPGQWVCVEYAELEIAPR